MKNVAYAGQLFQVPNHFFPLRLRVLHDLPIGGGDIPLQLPTASERFVAGWLGSHALSPQAQALLQAGTAVYRTYFAATQGCGQGLPPSLV